MVMCLVKIPGVLKLGGFIVSALINEKSIQVKSSGYILAALKITDKCLEQHWID